MKQPKKKLQAASAHTIKNPSGEEMPRDATHEEQMKILIQYTSSAVAMFDQDMRYLLANDRWIQDYQLEKDKLIGHSHEELSPQYLNTPKWKEKYLRALNGEALRSNEEIWEYPDGKVEWINWAAHPWRNHQEEIGGIIVFSEIITKQKEASIRAQLLQEIALETIESHSVETIVQTVLDKMCRNLYWPLGHAYIWNENQQELESMRIWHFGKESYRDSEFRKVSEVMEYTADMPLPGSILETKQPVCVRDVATSSHFLRNKILANLDLHAGIFIPILINDQVKIVLEFFSSHFIPHIEDFSDFNQQLSIHLSRVLERKEAEKALEASNSLNQAILFSAPYMIIATDKQAKVLVFNQASEQNLGYEASEVIGQYFPSLWHDQKELQARAETLSQEWGFSVKPDFEVFVRPLILKKNDTSEWTYIRKNGSRFCGHLTITPIWNATGTPIGYLSIIEDITERKQQEQALKASEETFRTAIEHAPIGMALVEPDGRWRKVNQVLCDLLGYSKAELLSMDFQSITHPEELETDLEFLRQMLEGTRQTYQLEKRYFHKDGSIIWVLLSVSVVHTSEGIVDYFISQIQDITERKEMERMKNEFISIVSHELRTPLTSIRGSLGLMAGVMAKELPEKANHLINIAYKNSERLILLINDILDIDKIASGQMHFDIKPENLTQLLNQAIETNRSYAERFNVSFDILPFSADWEVDVDASRFLQVISNLLSNAAKFSPEGHSVELSAKLANNTIRVLVKDYGPGISEDFWPYIFDKFSQADSSISRQKGGTGLGLNISKQIIERMGGSIGFETELGKGTTFWIDIPLTIKHSPVVKADHLQQAAKPVHGHILVCEDNQEIASVMKWMIEQAGFTVDCASTLPEARRKLNEHHYHAMTLDILLPMGDGIKFLRTLRTQPETMRLPVVIVSATADQSKLSLNEEDLGVTDWLTKPIDELKLVTAIKNCIPYSLKMPTILHIEDDVDLSTMLATALQGKAELVTATTLGKAEEYLKSYAPDLIILDLGLPDGCGLQLLEHPSFFASSQLPVLILSATEVGTEIKQRVAATMVKSRLSETKIVETILALLKQRTYHDN